MAGAVAAGAPRAGGAYLVALLWPSPVPNLAGERATQGRGRGSPNRGYSLLTPLRWLMEFYTSKLELVYQMF